MIQTDRCIELVKDILDDYQNGMFRTIPDISEKYTYEYLVAMFQVRDALSNGVELFRMFYDGAMFCAKTHIKEKASRGEVLRVAFMSYSAAQWPAERLFRDLEKDNRFHPYIIVSPLTNRDAESSVYTYNETLDWYQKNGYEVYGGLTDHILSWSELGGFPDIVVHLSSWYECIPEEQQFLRLPWKCLNLYVPYGIYEADNRAHTYSVNYQFNKDIINVVWRVYADSVCGKNGYNKYSVLGGANAVLSGYLKMDELMEREKIGTEKQKELWKVPDGADFTKYRKVIIAPHFQMDASADIVYSTFRDNFNFWLYLAEKYQDTVTFIFKPHPNLRGNAVAHGLFTSYEKYDEYIECWNKLPNARAVTESKYLDFFQTSDAMIMDSGSFLGEYLYTRKPLLFLTREEQAFNELGSQLVDAYYRAPGNDYMAIERFLREVVLQGMDNMQEVRNRIFDANLNYRKLTGKLAHEVIYKDILQLIE